MKIVLKRIKKWLIFQKECYLDGRRYLKATTWAGRIKAHSLAQLESEIVRRYHVIEKGLSMPDFRPRFGKDTVRELVGFLAEWDGLQDKSGGDAGQIDAARSTIVSYKRRHKELGVDVSDLTGDCLQHPHEPGMLGGAKVYAPIDPGAALAFDMIVRSRTSVRSFDSERNVPRELVLQVVSQAISAPSVCNRQTWRVHQYDGSKAQRMLKYQSGNRGFGHSIPCVLVVTSDLRFFTGTAERYQAWIDGGMFAMLILLGLHAKGLGGVALNWSVFNSRDRQLRVAGDIPEHERIIMLIGCGYPAPGALVPMSHRRTPESILTHHG